MLIALAILYPRISQQQTIAIFLTIGKLSIEQFGTLFHHPTLYLTVTSKDTINDMQVGVRRTYLQSNSTTISRELIMRNIEPFVSLCGRTLIIKTKHYEILLNSICLTNSQHSMLS